MAGDDEGKEIVRTEHDPNAGTCESTIYVCKNGTRWRETPGTMAPTSTGESRGYIRKNKIEPT